jgi:hypothetical protein
LSDNKRCGKHQTENSIEKFFTNVNENFPPLKYEFIVEGALAEVVAKFPGSLKDLMQEFIKAIAMHRHWERETVKDQVPA